jgi:sugar O-acyltransferase (sialic acid O-acetyltransferase NeuD family)
MMRIVLLGGGGHASDVLGVLEARNDAGGIDGAPIEVVGILDDNPVDPARFVGRGVDHLGPIAQLGSLAATHGATHYVLAAGWPASRHALHRALGPHELTAATLVHPTATVSHGVELGEGTVIMAGVHLSPMVRIGRHACCSNHAVAGHDAVVGDYAGLMPASVISGSTTIGEGCLVGANATVIEGRTLGAWAKVGAGAVAIADIEPGVTVVGVPARAVTPNASP